MRRYFFLVGSPGSRINLNLFATPIKKGSTERPAVIHGYYHGAKHNRALTCMHVGAYELFVSLTRCIYRSRDLINVALTSRVTLCSLLSCSPLSRRSSLSLPCVIKQLAAERRFIVHGANGIHGALFRNFLQIGV